MKIPFIKVDTEEHYTEIWLFILGMAIWAILMWPYYFVKNKLKHTPTNIHKSNFSKEIISAPFHKPRPTIKYKNKEK